MAFPYLPSSEASHLLATKEWSNTSLGPLEAWPDLLKSSLMSCFASRIPTAIYWGPKFILFYNDAYAPIAGNKHPYSFGEPGAEVWKEIWSDIEAQFESVMQKKIGLALNDQMLLMDRFGQPQEAYFDYSLSPILDSKGEAFGIHNTAFEITEKKLATAAKEHLLLELGKSQKQLFFALDSARMATWHIDLRTNFVSSSHGADTIFGLEIPNQNLFEAIAKIMHPDDQSSVNAKWTKAVDTRSPYYDEFRVVLEDGSIRWLSSRGAISKSVNGVSISYSGLVGDITERVLATQALEKAKHEAEIARDEAERANQLKSSFLANMSHEIRTPLGAMMGFADLLGEPRATVAERANYIDILHRNGEQLSRIINDILDLSKVETGHINFEYLKVRPLQIVTEVVSLMSVLAKEKGLLLTLSEKEHSPQQIVSDPTRIRQVLTNLVGNALKFTKVGSIHIEISGSKGQNGETYCAFDVKDTGTGIPSESAGKLFKMFMQADNSITRKYGGTGLGLALSRSLARSLGGDVTLVKSSKNVGSTFRFSVQSRDDLDKKLNDVESIHSKKIVHEIESNALAGIRVLLVEDSPDNQQLIWRYLSKYGAVIEIADNGLEGIAKALSQDHDVVLMDLQMPVMDGYTATGKLRSRGYKTPIIALTAHAMSDVRKKCQDVGCNDHLSKPIVLRDLIETVSRYAKLNTSLT